MLGFINLYKPRGASSAFAVGRVKKLIHQKCGHMGTLDPLASGILPIGINQANRLFQYMLGKKKIYEAVFDFAYETPSLDSETEAIKTAEYIPTTKQLLAALPNFVGKILQKPPIYSAKMVDGKRSYKLARSGKEFELESKEVEVSSITLKEQVSESAYAFRIECFGGTYIRSLARDIGECFSCAATMTALERVACGAFSKENSISIDELLDAESIEPYLIMPQDTIDFTKLKVSTERETRMLNGLFDEIENADGLYRVYGENGFIGVGRVVGGVLKIETYIRDLG